MERKEKVVLERHGGCEYCSKECQFNGPVAHPDRAAETKGKRFDCNSVSRGL